MEFEEIKQAYLDIDRIIHNTGSLTPEMKEILSRGYVCCDNTGIEKGVPIMLTGINPSYNEKDKDTKKCPHSVIPFVFKSASNRFWTEKKRQFGDLTDSMAYFDLFPIRETKHKEIFEKSFLYANGIRGRILEITQRAIEDIAPKLIVHTNRGSMFYWGIKTYGRGEDHINPWMGYSVERVTRSNTPDLPKCCTKEHLNRFPLYRIVGFVDSEKRINNAVLKKSNLTYLMEYVMQYRNEEYRKRLYSSENWKEIWNWLKK